jgi:putative ABC transport system ATP-binding protein
MSEQRRAAETVGDPAVVLEGVSKRYGDGPRAVAALVDVNLSVQRGEFVSIMGASGCGKSTLLNLLAGLDLPDTGRIVVAGQDLATLSDTARADLRLAHIGFVFQSFQLLPTFTVEENVAWPLELQGLRPRRARERAHTVLEETGIGAVAFKRLPAELSGGEQQRVAIARALATQPLLLLADEPTGNLDSRTGLTILDLLRALNRKERVTVVMVTHSMFAGAYGHRRIELCDGRIEREHRAPSEPQLHLVQERKPS